MHIQPYTNLPAEMRSLKVKKVIAIQCGQESNGSCKIQKHTYPKFMPFITGLDPLDQTSGSEAKETAN